MALEINDWNVTAGSNNSTSPDGWPENTMPIDQTNNAAREGMSVHARHYQDQKGLTTAGTSSAYTCTLNSVNTGAWYDGLFFRVKWHVASAANPTINPTGSVALGAKNLIWPNGNAVKADELPLNGRSTLLYDGTSVQVLSAVAGPVDPNNLTSDLTITSTDSGAGQGPSILLDRNSASQAAADEIGAVEYGGRTDTGSAQVYANLRGFVVAPTNSLASGGWGVRTPVAGPFDWRLRVASGAYVGATAVDKGVGTLNAESGLYHGDSQLHAVQDGLNAPVATTSGTAHDFTGIRSDARRITIMMDGVSLSGTDNLLIQIGPVAAPETTGYSQTNVDHGGSGNAFLFGTSGFQIALSNASRIATGSMTLTLMDATANKWVCASQTGTGGNEGSNGSGRKSLAGTLTQVRITRDGSDTFDAGSVSILVE